MRKSPRRVGVAAMNVRGELTKKMIHRVIILRRSGKSGALSRESQSPAIYTTIERGDIRADEYERQLQPGATSGV